MMPFRPSPLVFRYASLFLAVLLTTSVAAPRVVASDQHVSAPAPAIELYRDKIAPLLSQHCCQCHGPELQRGGLRLDSREEARKGGHSGAPILGGSPEENELYRRVSSHDRTYWMPKGQDRLSEEEVTAVAQWVAEGTPWPEPETTGSKRESSRPSDSPADAELRNARLLEWLADLGDRAAPLAPFAGRLRHYLPWLVSVLLVIVVLERCGKAYDCQRPWTTGRARRLFALCSRLRPSTRQYLVGLAAFFTFIYIQADQGVRRELRARIAAQNVQLQTLTGQIHQLTREPTQVYGDPPIPIRPNHPPRLHGTYYRGNCERSPDLFNNGHYLTARMHLGLFGPNQQPLETGDVVDLDSLSIWFEIERGPNATPGLFSEGTMTSVFLSPHVYRPGDADLSAQPCRLKAVKPGERWAVHYPLDAAPGEDRNRRSGIVYVYVRRGELHYGIHYDLRIEDGKLQVGSDLWMGSLYWTPRFALPQRDRVPLDEWFDYRPIPEVTGPNSTDPELLGIPEHVQKTSPAAR